jgi:hypothetical protein
VSGSWKRLVTAASRWNLGSAKLEPSTWVLYGGLAPDAEWDFLPKNDVRYLDLDRLSEPAFGDAAADGPSALQTVRVYGEQSRAFHSLAAVDGSLLSIMGLYSVPHTGGKYAMSVSVTKPQLGFGARPSGLSCQLPPIAGSGEAEWCGFDQDLPGYSYDQQVVVRRDTALLLSYKITRATSALFWELNVTKMNTEGQNFFRDWSAFEQSGGDSLSRAFLQYTLVGVCFILLLSLGFLLKARQHRGPELMFLVMHKKSRGVSKDVIRALDFVTFDVHGAHRKVKLQWPTPPEPQPSATGDREAPAPTPAPVTVPPANPAAEPSGEPTILEVGEPDVTVDMDPARPPRDAETCAICIMDFEQDELLIRLPCKHLFHWDCVEPWLLKNGTCPQCRRHVVTGEELVEKSTSVVDGAESSGQGAPSASSSAATVPEPAPHEAGDLAGARRVSLRASLRASLRRSRRASRRDGGDPATSSSPPPQEQQQPPPPQQQPQQQQQPPQQQRQSLSHRLAGLMPSFSSNDAGSSSALAAHGGAEMSEVRPRDRRSHQREPSI